MHSNIIELNSVYCFFLFISLLSSLSSSFVHPSFISITVSSYASFFPIFSIRFLIFRKMLSCGFGKLQGSDRSWKDLTAMNYHYWTMPLPNPVSYYMHKLPGWVHAYEVMMLQKLTMLQYESSIIDVHTAISF
jgi:hypothetical protein